MTKGWCCLCGKTGTGKTALACCKIYDILKNSGMAVYWPVKEFIDELYSRDFDEKYEHRENAKQCDLLVFDEIGRSSESASFRNEIFSIIDYRHKFDLQTILI